jgi:5'-methylthioadenosine/S-adenosylhomocysteine nucleosidase
MQNDGKRIGIIGALYEEIEPLLNLLESYKKLNIGMAHFYEGAYDGNEIVLALSGTGKVNAAVATQKLIDKFNAGVIIFTGIAGAISRNLKPGDVVIGTRLAHHDMGFLYGDDNFIPVGVRYNLNGQRDSYSRMQVFHSNDWLVKMAEQAAKEISQVHGFSAIKGTIVTGDQVILSSKKKKWLSSALNAVVVEMEGAAVAQTAYSNGVPFLVIRSISDNAGEDMVKNIEDIRRFANNERLTDPKLLKVVELATRNSAMLVKGIMDALGKNEIAGSLHR